ncbi:uncharacterized protein LOC131891101 isoform X1 [Tigriopus californicus]|uniref:uncharacterized protein LOC131891101 isoform X1 n=1 Tax=Tigriopus californicus TaxID=6832 RepID=UPI0027DA315C|nr:uncharacterized protein LOC131891101 isoform X1 [Tigriopus californicus]
MVFLRQLYYFCCLSIASGQKFSFQEELETQGHLRVLSSEGGRISLTLISLEYMSPIETEYEFFQPELTLTCRCQCSSQDVCPKTSCELCFLIMGTGYDCVGDQGFQLLDHHTLCCQAQIIPGNHSYQALFIGEPRRVLKLRLVHENSGKLLTNVTFHLAGQNVAAFLEFDLQLTVDAIESPKHDPPLAQVAIVNHQNSNLTFLPPEIINQPWEWCVGKIGWLRKVGGKFKFPDQPEMSKHIYITPQSCKSTDVSASFDASGFKIWQNDEFQAINLDESWFCELDRKIMTLVFRPKSPKPIPLRLTLQSMLRNSSLNFQKVELNSESRSPSLKYLTLDYYSPGQLFALGQLSWCVRGLVAGLDDGHLRERVRMSCHSNGAFRFRVMNRFSASESVRICLFFHDPRPFHCGNVTIPLRSSTESSFSPTQWTVIVVKQLQSSLNIWSGVRRLSLPSYYDLYLGIFLDAPAGSVFDQVYQTKVAGQEDAYFINEPDGLEKITANEDLAVFYNIESFADYKMYQCQIEAPWVTLYPGLLSVAFPKDSEYFPFIQYQTMRLLDQGTSSRALKAILREVSGTCEVQEQSGLGLHKLISLFGLLTFAAVLSIVILSLERAAFSTTILSQDLIQSKSMENDGQADIGPQLDLLIRASGIEDKRAFSNRLYHILSIHRQ